MASRAAARVASASARSTAIVRQPSSASRLSRSAERAAQRHDGGAALGQEPGRGPADPLAGPRHQDRSSRELMSDLSLSQRQIARPSASKR